MTAELIKILLYLLGWFIIASILYTSGVKFGHALMMAAGIFAILVGLFTLNFSWPLAAAGLFLLLVSSGDCKAVRV
jgi:hypothetical membrane protein